jgi:branched-chain amino acid aminotransferase
LTSGCLPGITREALREVIPAAGYTFLEQNLTPGDLDSAEEVFISSTTREVAGVGSIQPNWKYPAPGKVTREIESAFQNYVKAHLYRSAVPRS